MTSTRTRTTAKAEPATKFEPEKHLSRVSGGDYLEVKWRLVWVRDRHPDATIDTELVSHGDNTAVFKATVILPTGARATGYGSETAGDFRDYLEKAETKAIGRALGALGFGTQFSGFDFSLTSPNGSATVVDAPVATTPSPQPAAEPEAEVAVTRSHLLAQCTQQRERIGAQAVLDWMNENTKDETDQPKRKASQLTDDELGVFLTWAATQPDQSA